MEQNSSQQKDFLTLDDALLAHLKWKLKLQDAERSGEVLDVETIKRDDCCVLGQWLYADGRRHYGHLPEFTTLLAEHKEFHYVTAVIAWEINAKHNDSTKPMLAQSPHFSAVSNAVGIAISRLKGAVKTGKL